MSNAQPLALDGHFPLEWQTGASTPDYPRDTLISLHALQHALEDNQGEDRPYNLPDRTQEALMRMDAKINLLIELIGVALRRQAPLPNACAVHLTSDELIWLCEQAPADGAEITVAIYLHPYLPLPLRVSGHAEVKPLDGRYRVRLSLSDLEPEAREALSRQIFLLHRREIRRRNQGF